MRSSSDRRGKGTCGSSRHSRGVREAQSGDARASLYKVAVRVSMVAAHKLEQLQAHPEHQPQALRTQPWQGQRTIPC